MEISISCDAWKLRDCIIQQSTGLEAIHFHIWYAMCFWKVKDGHLTILTDCPSPHSGLRHCGINTESVTCKRIHEKYINYSTNYFTKLSGFGQENDFLLATILGTGKSIDFYYFLYFN